MLKDIKHIDITNLVYDNAVGRDSWPNAQDTIHEFVPEGVKTSRELRVVEEEGEEGLEVFPESIDTGTVSCEWCPPGVGIWKSAQT